MLLARAITRMMHPQSLLQRPSAPCGSARAAAFQARRTCGHAPGGGTRALHAPRARAPGADEELDIDALISDTDAMKMLRRSLLGQMRDVETAKVREAEAEEAPRPAAGGRGGGGMREGGRGGGGMREGGRGGGDGRASRDARPDGREGRGGRDERFSRDGGREGGRGGREGGRGGREGGRGGGRDGRGGGRGGAASGRRQSMDMSDKPVRETVIPTEPGEWGLVQGGGAAPLLRWLLGGGAAPLLRWLLGCGSRSRVGPWR
jgi:hypothetical protein